MAKPPFKILWIFCIPGYWSCRLYSWLPVLWFVFLVIGLVDCVPGDASYGFHCCLPALWFGFCLLL